MHVRMANTIRQHVIDDILAAGFIHSLAARHI